MHWTTINDNHVIVLLLKIVRFCATFHKIDTYNTVPPC
jgi:hypothetical protein